MFAIYTMSYMYMCISIYILYNRLCTRVSKAQSLTLPRKHTKTRHFSTNTTLFDISPLRPSKNTQKPKTHKNTTLFDFTQKTHKNTTLFDISPLRPSKNTQKHDTFRHVLPSAMQKHTKTLLFTTFPPFDHAKA